MGPLPLNRPKLPGHRIRLTLRGWARDITNLVAKSPQLSGIAFDLGNDLGLIELTSSMPNTLISQLERFVNGYMQESGESAAEKTASFISVRLVGRLNIQDAALREYMLAECLQLLRKWMLYETSQDSRRIKFGNLTQKQLVSDSRCRRPNRWELPPRTILTKIF